MPEPRPSARRRAARVTAATAALFSTVLALLLLANLVQVRAIDPLANPALETLRARLAQQPADEALREQVRALDLLARKAFFASQWQRRTGGVLLGVGVLVTLLAARIMADERRLAAPRVPLPDAGAWWVDASRARRWVTVTGCALLAASAAVAFGVRSPLDGARRAAAEGPDAGDALGAEDWPFFRGPGGNGVAHSVEAPLAWDGASGRGIAWKVEVPLRGNSSPIVVGDRLFLTGADERTQEVYCFDRRSGVLRWRGRLPAPPSSGASPQLHPDTGYAAPTAASDGRRVFAIFANGALASFDLDGKLAWSQSLGVPENHYGHASSLITFGGLLIVQWDQSAEARLLAFDAATGQEAWRTARDAISWSSPVLVHTGARHELLVNNSTSVAAYDPRTGALLWRSDCLGGEVGPSPAYADGLVFVANDRATAAAVRPGGEVVWRYQDELPDTASPVATKDFVFLATSYGVLVCLDAKTGRALWKHELPAGCYASPLVLGDRVYVLDLTWRHARGEGGAELRATGHGRARRAGDGHAGDRRRLGLPARRALPLWDLR